MPCQLLLQGRLKVGLVLPLNELCKRLFFLLFLCFLLSAFPLPGRLCLLLGLGRRIGGGRHGSFARGRAAIVKQREIEPGLSGRQALNFLHKISPFCSLLLLYRTWRALSSTLRARHPL